MDLHGSNVGGVIGGVLSPVLCFITGMVTAGQFIEVVLWAFIGAVVGWLTQIILNKFFKEKFNNFLNKLFKKPKHGNPS